MPKKLTIQDVKDYIANYAEGQCSLLSTEYINSKTPLKFRCNQCGEEFERDFEHMKRGRYLCEKCAFLSRKQPNQGSIQDVILYLQKNDIKHECTLISDSYKNSNTPLVFKCNVCDNYFTRDFDHVKRGRFRCSQCGIHAGAIHRPSGGVGILQISLRSAIQTWKKKVLLAHPQCDISGSSQSLVVHHLNINFSDVVKEAMANINFNLRGDSIQEYSESELDALRKEVLRLHNEKVEGVVLTNDLHNQFHREYGFHNNTLGQYLEFKEKIRKDKLYGISNTNPTDDSTQ